MVVLVCLVTIATHMSQILYDIFGDGEFFPNDALIDFLAEYVCPFDRELEKLCRDVIFLICGFDVQNINVVS